MQVESCAGEMNSGRESDVFEFCSGAFDEPHLTHHSNLEKAPQEQLSSCQISDDAFFNVEEITLFSSSQNDELHPRPCDIANPVVTNGSDIQTILQVDAFKQTVLARRKRAVLNSQTAEDIFQLGAVLTSESRLGGSAPDPLSRRSTLVSQLYGISPKAVRDIWNRYST